MANSYDAEASLLKNIADTLGTMSGDSSQSTSYGDDYNENGPFDLKLKYLQKMSDSLDTIAGGGFGEDIFWVTYNETTANEIETAIQDGKFPVLVDINGNKINGFLPLTQRTDDSSKTCYYFSESYAYTDSGAPHVCIKYIFFNNDKTNGTYTWSEKITSRILTTENVSDANKVSFVYNRQYNTATVGHQLKYLTNMVDGADIFVFIATPTLDGNGGRTYVTSRTLEAIIDAKNNAKTIICFVADGSTLLPTIITNTSTVAGGILVKPILTNINQNIKPFEIYSDGQDCYLTFQQSSPCYLIPDDYGASSYDFTVHLLYSGDNYSSYHSINEKFDFGTDLEQLIQGAALAADGSGTATLATTFTDSESVSALDYISDRCIRNMQSARGVISEFMYGDLRVFTNIISASKLNNNKNFVTINLDMITSSISSGVLSSATVYSGYISLEVDYDNENQAECAVAIIHLNKHDATIV